MNQAGIATLTVIVVLIAAGVGTIGTPLIVDAVDARPDSPLYSLERAGESIKGVFVGGQDWEIERAQERDDEFVYMVGVEKANEYTWLVEESDVRLLKAAKLADDNEGLQKAIEANVFHLVLLENVKERVPAKAKPVIIFAQLQSYASVKVLENVAKRVYLKIPEPLKVELDNRLNQIRVVIENMRIENIKPPEFTIRIENYEMIKPEQIELEVENAYAISVIENLQVMIKEPLEVYSSEILEVFEELNLSVMENGSADLKYSLRLPESVLAELYAETFGIERPNSTVTLGAENLEAFQEATGILLGKETKITSAKAMMNVENELWLALQAEPLRLAEFDPDIGIWKTSIGALETDAMGLRVAQMMFMQLMLDSLPGKQRLESSSITSVELPESTTILNADELSELAWRVNFGGDTYREAFVEVRENTVVLVERTVVTERPITLSPDEFLENLFGFGTLTIEYEVGTSGTESDSRPLEPSTKNWSKKWCATRSYPISENFSWSGTYQGAYATADLNLNADPSLNVEVYIGWGYSGFKLQWFRTYWQIALHGTDAGIVIVVSENEENEPRTIFPGSSELPVLAEEETSINPPVSIHFSGDIRGGIESSWSREYGIHTDRFWFFIGWWPVWVDLDLDLIPGMDVSANASLQFDAGMSAWVSGKFGVEWTREDGWKGIKELDYDFGYTDSSIQGEADISIEPYVKFKAGLYIYSLVGPYAYLKPLAQLEVSYPERTWTLGAGFDINAGVGLGKLGRWLGLSDWEPHPPLYSLRMLLGSGNW